MCTSKFFEAINGSVHSIAITAFYKALMLVWCIILMLVHTSLDRSLDLDICIFPSLTLHKICQRIICQWWKGYQNEIFRLTKVQYAPNDKFYMHLIYLMVHTKNLFYVVFLIFFNWQRWTIYEMINVVLISPIIWH